MEDKGDAFRLVRGNGQFHIAGLAHGPDVSAGHTAFRGDHFGAHKFRGTLQGKAYGDLGIGRKIAVLIQDPDPEGCHVIGGA